MYRPTHFEIPAADPEAAAKFYSSLFGWKINAWAGPVEYWLVDTGEGAPGINGGILRRQHPQQPCVNTVEVPDIDASIAKVVEIGGQLAVAKMPVPGLGWLCYAKDPDGNIFGMMQTDPAAK